MRTRFSTLQFSLTGFNWAQEKSKGSHDTAHILSYLQVEEIIKIGPRGFIVKSLLLWNVSYITTPGHAVLTSANKLEDPYIASIQFRTHIYTHTYQYKHTHASDYTCYAYYLTSNKLKFSIAFSRTNSELQIRFIKDSMTSF